MRMSAALRRVRAARPGWGRLGLAALAGLGVATGLEPFNLWPVALVALAAGLWLIAREPAPGRAAWVGFAFGFGHFGLAMDWIFEPFLVDAARDGWMAPFAVVLMAAGMALFWALAAGVSALAPRRMLGLATALAAAELARGYVLTGLPWAAPGQVLIATPPGQLAALVGPTGLTAFALAVAGLLASLRALPALAGLLAFGLGWAWGADRLAGPEPADPGVALRLVQPDAEQTLKWDPGHARDFLNRLLTETAAAPAPGAPRPDLVIWPETALPYLLESSPELLPVLTRAAGGATLALGRQRVQGTRGWNTLSVYAPDGTELAQYDKHHLVPFGEYIPLGDLAYDLFGLKAFAARTGHAYTAGPGPQVLDLGPKLGRVLPLICYEAVFPQDVRTAPSRPGWLLQVTNDAWFGTFSGPFQHAAQARLRAIETGLPLVRVANTGLTEVVDARGRVTASLPFGIQGHLDAALPGARPATPYWRWGELPLLVWLAGCGLLAFLRRRRPAA
jgi:apolipoprotein N-acyltransferase